MNDADCFLSNFWRSIKNDPEQVADYANWPVNEADLHARHLWLVNREEFRERMKTDPEYYDCKIAGWWVWGACSWIGTGWCSGKSSWGKEFSDGELAHPRMPHVGDAGMGINRQLPHVGNAGMGINRQLPHVGDAGREPLFRYFEELSNRLRRVRVCCGDWSRIMGDSVTVRHGITGVFLDPPYASDRNMEYAVDSGEVAHDVREWAIANGDNPMLRIALCGYAGEHAMPEGWEEIPWKAAGGYGSQSNGKGRENAAKERIWFSPHCLHELSLFKEAA